MNLDESPGGSSCNEQENGDGFNGSERPLKKARFAWQVKGKYHLKNEDNDPAKISATECTAPETAGPSGSGSNLSNSDNISSEQDNTTIGGYLVNKNLDALNSEDDDTDNSDLKPSKRNLGSKDTPSATLVGEIFYQIRNFVSQIPLSRYVLPTNEYSEELLDFVLMVASHEKTQDTEDLSIARWQARQLARGHLDNTINTVLEIIKQTPVEEGDATLEAFDVADIINNRPGVGENSIENEGILMAISAHGLQNNSNASSSFNSVSSSMSTDFNEILSPPSPPSPRSPLPDSLSPAVRICFSPAHSEVDYNEQIQLAWDTAEWPYSDDLKSEDNVTKETPTFHGTSSLSFENPFENLHNTEAASNDVEIESDDERDFIDTAVLFAIQTKGLTTFGTGYG